MLEAILTVNREVGVLPILITRSVAIARIAHQVIRIGEGRVASDSIIETRAELKEISW